MTAPRRSTAHNRTAAYIFLRKVGGGYIFIHRMLMEYFASLETPPSAGSGK